LLLVGFPGQPFHGCAESRYAQSRSTSSDSTPNNPTKENGGPKPAVLIAQRTEALRRVALSNNAQTDIARIHIEPSGGQQHHVLTPKEIKERKVEKNMFYMALTLCSISILSRLVNMLVYVYFFFYRTFEGTLTVAVVYFFINAFVPTVSIFIFFLFNPAPSKGGSKMTLYLLNTKVESFLTPL
jgi:hypothetical protein